jgi:hypothetical protein
MAERCRPRIIRRAVMALAVVVLLPGWYVASWLSISRLADEGFVSRGTTNTIRPAFEPVLLYCECGMPGADVLTKTYWAVNPTPPDVFVSGERWQIYPIRPSGPLHPNRD